MFLRMEVYRLPNLTLVELAECPKVFVFKISLEFQRLELWQTPTFFDSPW
jgi:hypothetical protein